MTFHVQVYMALEHSYKMESFHHMEQMNHMDILVISSPSLLLLIGACISFADFETMSSPAYQTALVVQPALLSPQTKDTFSLGTFSQVL